VRAAACLRLTTDDAIDFCILFAIPIHYGTFPVLKGTPQEYIAALGQTTMKVFAINPGDRLEF
jgi:hypothetical protein